MATPEHKLTGKSAGEGVQNSAEKKAAEPAEGKEAASEEWRVARGQGAGDATSTGEQSTSTAGGYKIHIPMYEGPLDLLLDLIKQQKMSIHDIRISKITAQYLDYLHKLEELDVDVSSEFIYMAATLIYIKSKMLLPPDPLAGPEEAEDPRADQRIRRQQHLRFDVDQRRRIRWPGRKRRKIRGRTWCSAWWNTRNSRMRRSFCIRSSRLKRMCGRSRTSRS